MKLYIIENTINSKKYIGQTVSSIEERWSQHISAAKKGSTMVVAKAIRKYGRHNFRITELMPTASFSQPLLDLFEKVFIKIFRTNESEFGYNKTDGGKKYWDHLPETRQKISISLTGHAGYWTGKKQTPASNQKRSQSLKGQRRTEEQRKRMSASAKNRGISAETREKMIVGQRKWLSVPENKLANLRNLHGGIS